MRATPYKRPAIYAAVLILCAIQLVNLDLWVIDRTIPSANTFRLMLWSKYFAPSRQRDRMMLRKNEVGECEWTPPEPLDPNQNPARTLLVSYPGSGERLAWRIIEALTGTVVGDDWDLSNEGINVATLKTSYPHNEGAWSWGDSFYDANIIFLIRSPRWAIPSYFDIRSELGFSNGIEDSKTRVDFTYTERPATHKWNRWAIGNKGANFKEQLEKWGWMIDFYMNNGRRAIYADGSSVIDAHCRPENEIIHSCIPKAIISYERLGSTDKLIGEAETMKLANAMIEGRENEVPMADRIDWGCGYDKVIDRRKKEERWDGTTRKGPPNSRRRYRSTFLEEINAEIIRLITTYSDASQGWDVDPLADDLVSILAEYRAEIDAELRAMARAAAA